MPYPPRGGGSPDSPVSDGDGTRPPRKRRRPALSCKQCRVRKVKCDREFPSCKRCITAGQGQNCAYSDDIFRQPSTRSRVREEGRGDGGLFGDEDNASRRRPASPGYRPRFLGERNVTLQDSPNTSNFQGQGEFFSSYASFAENGDNAQQHKSRPSLQSEEIGGTMFLKGRDSQTRFYGQTYAMNMYSQFTELRSYIQEVKAQNPSMNQLRAEHSAIQAARPRCLPVVFTPMIELVPPREICDALVEDYLHRFETSHRILHIPTFRKAYEEYWETPSKSASLFVAQLLAMLAPVLILHKDDGLDPRIAGLTNRETAIEYMFAIDDWIRKNPPRRPYLGILQLHCLLILVKRINGLGTNKIWLDTGALVKLAMSAGYHREPVEGASMFPISPFYKEMRRRIWATIVEFDLQAALDRGLTPTVREGDFDTFPPLNIDDKDLHENLIELPIDKPRGVYTDTSFQSLLARSLNMRLHICAAINGASVRLNYNEVLDLDEEITSHLNDLPSWTSSFRMPLLTTLLDLTIRQYYIVLHTPFASKANLLPRLAHSRRVSLEAAINILCQHQDRLNEGENTLCFLRNDAFPAALTICYELYHTDMGFGALPIRRIIPNFSSSMLSLAESAREGVETRSFRLRKGLKEFYLLTMIISLIKTKLSPATAEQSKMAAVDQVLKTGYRLYSLKVQAERNLVDKMKQMDLEQRTQEPLGRGVIPAMTGTTVVQKQSILTPSGSTGSDDAAFNGSMNFVPDYQGVPTDFQVPDELDFFNENFEVDLFGMWNAEEMLNI